jgi:hypothetical protein
LDRPFIVLFEQDRSDEVEALDGFAAQRLMELESKARKWTPTARGEKAESEEAFPSQPGINAMPVASVVPKGNSAVGAGKHGTFPFTGWC